MLIAIPSALLALGLTATSPAQQGGDSRQYDAPVRVSTSRQGSEWSDARFRSLDRNGDNRLSRREWSNHGENDLDFFDRSDTNGDGFISRREFFAIGSDYDRSARQSRAYRAGYDRGVIEGREAGREDKVYRNQWDLEGQSELEQADSGYTADLGDHEDYQTGYRAGFRRAYAERFGPH